ncbi:hypothetical protein IV454_25070 [Massilia antarctica]|uniref:Peptidase M50 n=1 Tax=Massilia antarctica TaxID=2765360 RepID=A0AA49A7F9_9BURK|nr:hypothetical protein [Massilia antarctica]QPI48752.1 hypothetical protein IV454_25070 [Massilia antarctica]
MNAAGSVGAAAPLPRLAQSIKIGPDEFVGGAVMCFAKNSASGMYFRMGEREAFILRRLDGEHSGAQIAQEYEQAFAKPMNELSLRNAFALFFQRGLLDTGVQAQPQEIKPAASAVIASGDSMIAQRLFFWNPDAYLARLVPAARFIINGPVLLLWAIGLMAFELFLLPQMSALWDAALLASPHSLVARAATLFGFVMGMTVLHEAGHAIACKRHGGDVREVGIMMRYFMLTAYTSVDDMLLFPKRTHRVQVLMIGPLISLSLIPLAFLAWRYLPAGSFMQTAAIDILVWYNVGCLIQLVPFLQSDTYFMLAQALRMPDLRKDANAYLFNRMGAFVLGRRPTAVAANCAGYVVPVYFAYGILAIVVNVAAGIYLFTHYFQSIRDFLGPVPSLVLLPLVSLFLLWRIFANLVPWIRNQLKKLHPKTQP